eukprot:734013-Rhodomonas_salina.2
MRNACAAQSIAACAVSVMHIPQQAQAATANSNTTNRIPGANCTENAVCCCGFRGVPARDGCLTSPRVTSV